MILKGLKDRMKHRFNIALAEEDYSDLWQRARIGIVTLAAEKQAIMNTFDKIVDQMEQNGSVQVLDVRMEYL